MRESQSVTDTGERKRQLLNMIGPLRMIFWGGLLCLFDFSFSSTVNGEGFTFDILNDFLGMILISVGVFRLGRIELTHSYSKAMIFVMVVCLISTVKALIDHAVFETAEGWDFFWTFFGLVELAAIVVFCFTMRLLCHRNGLEGPANSWRTTSVLFVVVFVLPLGFLYLAILFAMVTGESFHIDLGPAGLLALFVLAVPLVHFFVSTSRTARAAEHAAAEGV